MKDIGLARTRAAERGRVADVYWDTIEKFRPFSARVLGHVMAHEIGHLLLPTRAHSRDGLMRASWDRRDVERLKTGGLLFTRDQGDLIRRKIADLTREEVIDYRLAASASR